MYNAGSYCYTLVKCLKPFVRNEKGVIVSAIKPYEGFGDVDHTIKDLMSF
jgi:hypothetical protein